MLAYLFFHRCQAGGDVGAYEDGLRGFHTSLAAATIDGFRESRTYRVGDRYCDWYIVESSAALDVLNDAAVGGARSALHEAVARMASDGEGKLLKLAAGSYDSAARFEIRFSKPRGMSYSDLYQRLEDWTGQRDVSLWRRMMVLGPPPEFILLAPSAVDLPGDLGAETFRRDPI